MPSKTKVLSKVSKILYCFSPEEPVWTATALSKKIDIPVTTLHGILADLVALNFLEQDHHSKLYRIGLRFMEMGEQFTNNFELNNIAHGVMRELTTDVETLVGLSILYKSWMYVSMSTVPLKITNSFRYVGPKMPAYNSAGGKMILAFLSAEQQRNYLSIAEKDSLLPFDFDKDEFLQELATIRKQRYAFLWNNGKRDTPFSIAAPIFGRERQILASLVVISPYKGFDPGKVPFITQSVTNSAQQISVRCGHLSSGFGVDLG